jgi:formate hydrogenlyase subunit 6/NADH:ubiquinone oxidoreductase subunit I
MKIRESEGYRSISLIFLVIGTLGMFLSTAISTHFRTTLPTTPIPEEQRMTPRNISGVIVYETDDEDRKLDLIEYSSALTFAFGACLGCVYAARWGTARAIGDDVD